MLIWYTFIFKIQSMNRGINCIQPNMKSTYACLNTNYN